MFKIVCLLPKYLGIVQILSSLIFSLIPVLFEDMLCMGFSFKFCELSFMVHDMVSLEYFM